MAMTREHSGEAGPLGCGALGATTVKTLIGVMVSFVIIIIITLLAFWEAGCPKSGIQCPSGTCLPRSKWCNNFDECQDGKDESKEECLDYKWPRLLGDVSGYKKCSLCHCDFSNANEYVAPEPYEPSDIYNEKIKRCNKTTNEKNETEFVHGHRQQRETINQTHKDVENDIAKQSRGHMFTEDPYDVDDWYDQEFPLGKYLEGVSYGVAGCHCEMESQLKCNSVNFTHIPCIKGSMTLLHILSSSIETLDPEILAQYPTLETLSLENNSLQAIQNHVFRAQKKLKHLFLSSNNISMIGNESFSDLTVIETIELDINNLRELDLACFSHTWNLKTLDLSQNELNFMENQSFPQFSNLTELNLHSNKMTQISNNLLENLHTLLELRLQNNIIERIRFGAFRSLSELRLLDLSGNKLHSVAGIFRKLHSLTLIYMNDIYLHDISESHFLELSGLKSIHFSTFRYCMYVPQIPRCHPNHSGPTTVTDLVSWKSLRWVMWIMAIFTIVSNILVICCRTQSRKDIYRNNNYDNNNILFIKNLAGADLLMGIYLLIMGVKDLTMRGNFIKMSRQWSDSIECTFAGFLATVSSEASMFILTFMALERYLFLRNSMKNPSKLSRKKACLCLAVLWIASISLAFFPAALVNQFYGTDTMCFPLHVNYPYLTTGWRYSAFLFIGLNSISLLLIIWSYVQLFLERRHSMSKSQPQEGDHTFSIRFFFIIFTNCVCWLPIIIVKSAALAMVEINGGVYAWLVILMLPINSAVNPILYTFSSLRFQKHLEKFSKAFRRIRILPRRQSSDTETMTNSSGPSFPTSHVTLESHISEGPLSEDQLRLSVVHISHSEEETPVQFIPMGLKELSNPHSVTPVDGELSHNDNKSLLLEGVRDYDIPEQEDEDDSNEAPMVTQHERNCA